MGSLCMMGIKHKKDVCDFDYECLSRCCVSGTCRHHRDAECRMSCKKNSECPTGCCGDNHCVLDAVCDGNKVNGD